MSGSTFKQSHRFLQFSLQTCVQQQQHLAPSAVQMNRARACEAKKNPPKSGCLSQRTHLQHNGHQLAASGGGAQRTSGGEGGMTAAFQRLPTQLRPNCSQQTWIITGQHWASKPQVHSHTHTNVHSKSLACKQTAWHSSTTAQDAFQQERQLD